MVLTYARLLTPALIGFRKIWWSISIGHLGNLKVRIGWVFLRPWAFETSGTSTAPTSTGSIVFTTWRVWTRNSWMLGLCYALIVAFSITAVMSFRQFRRFHVFLCFLSLMCSWLLNNIKWWFMKAGNIRWILRLVALWQLQFWRMHDHISWSIVLLYHENCPSESTSGSLIDVRQVPARQKLQIDFPL